MTGPTTDTSLATATTTLDKHNLLLQLPDHEIVIPAIRLNGKGKHKSQIKFLFSFCQLGKHFYFCKVAFLKKLPITSQNSLIYQLTNLRGHTDSDVKVHNTKKQK